MTPAGSSSSPPATRDADPRPAESLWQRPGGAQTVVLSSELVQDLRQEAIHAFLAIPRRGIEIGGLLFGESTDSAFRITAFEEVRCEHAFGPSYILSDLDRGHLAYALARHHKEGGASIIGFYRSYTGRDAQPDEADRQMLRTYFPRQQFVCLLLQPLSVEKCLGEFRFCSHGEFLAEKISEPFPFDPAQMQQSAANQPMPPTATPALFPTEPAPAIGPQTPGGPLRFLFPALFATLFVIATLAVFRLWQLQQEPRRAPLRIDARLDAGQMLLTWNSADPAIAGATGGLLLVDDGQVPQTLPLTAQQLRTGTLQYTPQSGSVRFRLRSDTGGGSVLSDTLRVIAAPRAPAPATPVRAIPPPPVQTAATPPVVRREVQPEIPSGIRRRLRAPSLVQVTVQIDETGHVSQAFSKSTGEGLDRYLATQAVKAARQWSFTPARSSDGVPQASTKTLSFEFTPAGPE